MRKKSLSSPLCLLMLALMACVPMRKTVRFNDALTPEEHLELARAYDTQGLKDKAEQNYQAALQGEKTAEAALMGLGNLAFAKKDFEAATAYYRRVLKKDPQHGGANNNLAMVYLEQSVHLDLAEKYAKRAAASPAYRVYAEDTLAQIRNKKSIVK